MVNREEIWLVMQYIHGMDIDDLSYYMRLQKFPEEMATICHGVLSALAYLHRKRIIHRDVKGDNIMIDYNGHVFLTDLGLSILECPHANSAAGTERFMAPEVHAMKSYKCNADVFSLGMTIVQMVTGEFPYYRLSSTDARNFIINNQRPHIREAMSHDTSNFLNLCLEWDPARRPSASELLKHDYLQTKAAPEALKELVELAQGYRDDDKRSFKD